MILAQNPNQRLKCAAIAAFLINRDHIQFGQDPAQERNLEQRFSREKINWAPAANPGKGGVEITLVIHRQNHRTFLDDPLGMDHPEAKEDPGDKTGQMIDREVPRVHVATVRPLRFKRPMISPTTPSIVRLELSMTCASSAMIRGDARREESALSLALIRSCCPCASRRRNRISREASM